MLVPRAAARFMCKVNPSTAGGAGRVMQDGSSRERYKVSSPEMLEVPIPVPTPVDYKTCNTL